jgi:branched-chain amino acid transport system substrate-binding protein
MLVKIIDNKWRNNRIWLLIIIKITMFNNIFRKSLAIIAVVVVIGLTLFFSNHNIEKVKIGFVGPLTGEYASYGIAMKNGVELALNSTDPEHKKFEVVYEDDNLTPATAVTVVNKLIGVDKINYIISAQSSGATSAIIPIVESSKKVMMITLASAPGLTKEKNYITRVILSDVSQGNNMSDYLNNVLKSQRIAGLYKNEPYGLGIKEIVEGKNKEKIVSSELFKSGEEDYRTSLLKIKAANPDTIIIVAHAKEYPIILRQISNLGIKANIIASETFKDDQVLSEAGKYADGVTTFIMEPKDYVGFSLDYKKVYNVDPSAYSMYAYDGTIALIKAISKEGDNVSNVLKYIHAYTAQGASGTIGFDKDGDRVAEDYAVYKVINGKFVKQ